jgi:repressor LexA
VLDFVRAHVARHGAPPTVREIGAGLGIASTNAVSDHLKALVRAGLIEKVPHRSRGLRAASIPVPGTLPVLGRIAAGRPIYATENVEGSIVADPFLVRDGSETFVLRVEGDSMNGDGILPGDYLFVRRQQSADRGQVVVALIEDEATVKRLDFHRGRVRLLASNPAYDPIEVGEGRRLEILGVVTGVFRRM